jgi:succinyl-CoA synthetase alpha subunit
MILRGRLRSGEYFDSVSLMAAGKDLSAAQGVLDAAVVMATPENRSILKASGLFLPGFEKARDMDLLLCVKASCEEAAEAALDAALARLRTPRGGSSGAEPLPCGVEAGVRSLPGANLALVSVAGRYAAAEAWKALRAGLHVFLFSNNVPLEDEVALKRYGRERGLLVMGPDCGTAIINGAPLGFANRVRRGCVGIVAASGTGLQEVSSILSNEGAGISQAIGTGGRDVKKEVGGIMFLEGLKALLSDPSTRVVVLVSKPPDAPVLRAIGSALRGRGKPVVAVFLGADPELLRRLGMRPARTLEEAALLAVDLSKGSAGERPPREAPSFPGEPVPGRKFVRGLFSGGTFCLEAQLIFREAGIRALSNAPLPGFKALRDPWKSEGHSLVDLGADAFTVGRPHPMIDFSLRRRRIAQEALDPGTALILLDVVLGYGSNKDPLSELAPSLREAKGPVFACSVTGTPEDPQDKNRVEEGLREAGARVFRSNAEASRYAASAALRQAGNG